VAKPVPVFVGSVDEEGTLWLDARALFRGYLRSLKNKPVQLTVKVLQRKKSQSQLGYLWGAVYPVIAEHFGYCDYELEAMHDEIMRVLRGLKPEPNPLKIRVSLAEMSHEDVSAYITDVRHWALVEHGIVTPDADRVEFKERGKKAAA
jgi:hypothetical protein